MPSRAKRPDDIDMMIFGENTEDIYAGIEWPAEGADAKKPITFLQGEIAVKKIKFPES